MRARSQQVSRVLESDRFVGALPARRLGVPQFAAQIRWQADPVEGLGPQPSSSTPLLSVKAPSRSDFSNVVAGDIGSRFGARLRMLRRARGLTQLDMAVTFGIDRSYICAVESGKKGVSLATLEVIALGLNLELSDLLGQL